MYPLYQPAIAIMIVIIGMIFQNFSASHVAMSLSKANWLMILVKIAWINYNNNLKGGNAPRKVHNDWNSHTKNNGQK